MPDTTKTAAIAAESAGTTCNAAGICDGSKAVPAFFAASEAATYAPACLAAAANEPMRLTIWL